MGTKVFILVGPTCVGKKDLARSVVIDCPNVRWLQTDTTRKPRLDESGELRGEQGHRFVKHADISADSHICIKRDGQDYYGVNVDLFNSLEGWSTLLILDEDGAKEMGERMGTGVVTIGVGAPSLREYNERLRARKLWGIYGAYYPTKCRCDYLVINDDLEMTSGMIAHIIKTETGQ